MLQLFEMLSNDIPSCEVPALMAEFLIGQKLILEILSNSAWSEFKVNFVSVVMDTDDLFSCFSNHLLQYEAAVWQRNTEAGPVHSLRHVQRTVWEGQKTKWKLYGQSVYRNLFIRHTWLWLKCITFWKHSLMSIVKD